MITVNHTPVGAVGGLAVLAGHNKYQRYLDAQRQQEAEMNQRWNLAQAQMQNQRDMQSASLAAQKESQQFGAAHDNERDVYANLTRQQMATFEAKQRKDMQDAGFTHDTERQQAEYTHADAAQKAGYAHADAAQKAAFDQQDAMDERNFLQDPKNDLGSYERNKLEAQRFNGLKKLAGAPPDQIAAFNAEIDKRLSTLPPARRTQAPEFGVGPDGQKWWRPSPGAEPQLLPRDPSDKPAITPHDYARIYQDVAKGIIEAGGDPTPDAVQAQVEHILGGYEQRTGRPLKKGEPIPPQAARSAPPSATSNLRIPTELTIQGNVDAMKREQSAPANVDPRMVMGLPEPIREPAMRVLSEPATRQVALEAVRAARAQGITDHKVLYQIAVDAVSAR